MLYIPGRTDQVIEGFHSCREYRCCINNELVEPDFLDRRFFEY
jgi:hypothetical protein